MSAPIDLEAASVSVLEVHNVTLFSRICLSLQQEAGEDASEPYSWWSLDGEERLPPHAAAIVVPTPLLIPWDDKRLSSAIVSKMEGFILVDMAQQAEFEALIARMGEYLNGLSYLLSSNYSLDVDWDMKRCLKAFGFRAEVSGSAPLFDRCINFLSYVADSSVNAALVFVNLKHFLAKNELVQLYEHAFFHDLRMLLIEQTSAAVALPGERKYIIDQDFLELWPSC